MASDPATPVTAAPSPLNFDALSPVAREVAEAMARVASDIALVIDHDGVIRSVAEGASPLPAEVSAWVGRRWVDTVSSDTRRKIELLLDELSTTSISQRREVNHPIVDGDAVPMAWTAIRLGEHGPVVAVGRDLRAVAAIQRRFLDSQHEMELDYWQRRHADNRYRTLFHVARDAVLVIDAESFTVLEVNEAAQALLDLGVRSDAHAHLPGRSLISRVPEHARAALAELLSTARSSGRAGEIRLRMTAQGATWDVSATPFIVGERQQLLVRACDHDDHGGTEGQPAVMRALVESTSDAVVITDSAGHIQLANPAFLTLVRRASEAQVKGQGLADVVGDRDGAWRDTLARTRLQGLCPRTPLTVMCDALGVAVEVASTLLTDGEQELLGFTLRTVEPPRAVGSSVRQNGWAELEALRAQIGLVPMATLLQDAGAVVERQIIATALNLAAGQVKVAARLLRVEASALSLRMNHLDLLATAHRGDHAEGFEDDDPPLPPRMN